MIRLEPVDRGDVLRGKNFNVAIFLDTIKVMNVKLCMVALLIETYLVISLLVTLIVYQDHNSIKQL